MKITPMFALYSKSLEAFLRLNVYSHQIDDDTPELEYSLQHYGEVVWVSEAKDIAEYVRVNGANLLEMNCDKYPAHELNPDDLVIVDIIAQKEVQVDLPDWEDIILTRYMFEENPEAHLAHVKENLGYTGLGDIDYMMFNVARHYASMSNTQK